MTAESRPTILFLCTGNSCRSQMAEGWAKSLHDDRYEIFSAGIEAHGLNPNAVQVMQEAGVDITGQKSQMLSELADVELNVVITVCGHADENCPVLPIDCQKLHVPFDDPPKLAREMIEQKGASEEEALECYRRVRDEIRAFIERLPAELSKQKANS